MGGLRVHQTCVQTWSEDYLLTLESHSLSDDDKRAADDSLDRLFIED